jgi:SAM-dependent methyltransferase
MTDSARVPPTKLAHDSSPPPYASIVAYAERCLEEYGDNYQGVGWTKSADNADTRYRIMLEMILDSPEPVSLLDFGCGAGHLYEYIQRQGMGDRIAYSGLDVSPKFLDLSRSKFPDLTFYEADLLAGETDLPTFDYVVINGVFTYRGELSQEQMLSYWKSLTEVAFEKAAVGLAFNVISPEVDWERDDLFHLPFSDLTAFVSGLSRRFVIRHDYGLYEYTTYVYRSQ